MGPNDERPPRQVLPHTPGMPGLPATANVPPVVQRMERPDPIVLARAPETEAERKELRAVCKRQAQTSGKRGKQLAIETERIYQASLEHAKSAVQIVRRPVIVQTPERPQQQGMRRTAAGLFVPGQ